MVKKTTTATAKVRRGGLLTIPKAMLDLAGLKEGSLVVLELLEEGILIKPLKITRVKVTPKAREAMEKVLREELELEEEKARRLAQRRWRSLRC